MNGTEAAKRFINLIKRGVLKRETPSFIERYGHVDDYSISQETKDLSIYNRFVNTSAFDNFRRVKVKTYSGDNY